MENRLSVEEWKKIYDRAIVNVGNLSRMKRVMNKALSGESIKVAFVGGSITAGAASTTPQTCYAYHVYEWWKNKFPMSEVEYINVGVGATTSKFGVARVQEDALSLEPDMVFTEFSVNDEDNDLYKETFEGLIRKILLSKSEPALFMFNNVFYNSGFNAQKVHNEIGKYYDLPIVSMKESLYHLVEEGIYTNMELSVDNLHPNDFGHGLIAKIIANLLERIYDEVTKNENTLEHKMPEKPLTKNRYFSSVRRSNRTTEPVLNGFVKDNTVKGGVWDVFRYGWSSKTAGSSILFEVEGTMIAIQYRKYAIHPAPIAKVVIDGDVDHAGILDANFDETWGDKLFLQDIVTDGKPGKHTVEIILTEAVEEREFYLASVITA
jgi:lysophospholipase L1-like esterase